MKGNKKLIIIIMLLVIVGASLSTYAIYKSSAEGEASAQVAKWVVKVNGSNMTTGEFEFSTDDIEWADNDNVKEGTIAPGSTGTIKLLIDASESEVSLDYNVTIGDIKADNNTFTNNNFSVAVSPSTDATGTIAYSSTANAMKKEITLNVTWTAQNTDGANEADMSLAGKTIKIPVTVTATQKY